MNKKRAFRLLMVIAAICFSCAVTVARAGNVDAEENVGSTVVEQKMKKNISIDVSDQSIDLVIKQLVEQADLNYIKSPNVIGNVSVTFNDVPLDEALANILAVHDCLYVPTDNVIRIITSAEMVAKAEPILTKTFEIVYVDAVEVVTALDKFKSPQGSVSSIKGTSHIIVTDTESKITEITGLLEKIDRITPQILVEARIYDITSRDKLDLGVQWSAGRRTNFDSTTGLPLNDDIISEKGGADTYIKSITNPFMAGQFYAPTNKTASSMIGGVRFGWLTPDVDIDATIHAKQEITEAKLLANPRIMVLDNEEAMFDIITEHPYVERTISAGTVTETVKFKNVGVNLTVTPHVTRDGMLRLNIAPTFNVFVERVTLSTTDVPVVDTRRVNTIALVKDGQTVVLGGMRKKDVSKENNKIPLLGDLPLVGGLFRFEGEDTSFTELVVFITPRIIGQEPDLTPDEQEALEETNFERPQSSKTRAEQGIVEEVEEWEEE
ncbi:MAG: type II secretion system protein GspD [Planctomycetota bacterium]|jgi:type IV pilus assembly protein PilQ